MLAPSAGRQAFISPLFDILVGGGLSIVVVGALVLFGHHPFKGHDYGSLFILGILLNWPHFIASYRVLYRSRASITQYPIASIWIPLALVVWCAVAIAFVATPEIGNLLLVLGSVYLARHYTGQTWGMIASFGFLAKVRIGVWDRRLIRFSLNALLLYHALWAASQSLGLVSPIAAAAVGIVVPHLTLVRIVALLVGAVGFLILFRRERRLPVAMFTPWAAVNVWYAAIAEDATMIFVVQLAHSLQYLAFPIRIEMNRAVRDGGDARGARRQGLFAYAAWVIAGVAIFEGLEPLLGAAFQSTGGTGPLPGVAASILITAISVHHYFVDGALYKLRNPQVRADLFAHVAAEKPAAPAVAGASG